MKVFLKIAAGMAVMMACAVQAEAGPRVSVWVNTGGNCGWGGYGGWVRPAPVVCYPRRVAICPTPVYAYWGPTVVSYSTYPVYPVVVAPRAPIVAAPVVAPAAPVVIRTGAPVVVTQPVCVSPGATFRWKQ